MFLLSKLLNTVGLVTNFAKKKNSSSGPKCFRELEKHTPGINKIAKRFQSLHLPMKESTQVEFTLCGI